MSCKNLYRQQPNKPNAHHYKALSQSWLSEANPLQGNCTQRGEGCCFVTDSFRDPSAKAYGDAYILCVDTI